VNIDKAFDNVIWKVIFKMMKRLCIKYADCKLLYNLYKDEFIVIKIQDEEEEVKKKQRS